MDTDIVFVQMEELKKAMTNKETIRKYWDEQGGELIDAGDDLVKHFGFEFISIIAHLVPEM